MITELRSWNLEVLEVEVIITDVETTIEVTILFFVVVNNVSFWLTRLLTEVILKGFEVKSEGPPHSSGVYIRCYRFFFPSKFRKFVILVEVTRNIF
jgi:hypothetical protein